MTVRLKWAYCQAIFPANKTGFHCPSGPGCLYYGSLNWPKGNIRYNRKAIWLLTNLNQGEICVWNDLIFQMKSWDEGSLESYCKFIQSAANLLNIEVQKKWYSLDLSHTTSFAVPVQIRRRSVLRSPFVHKKHFVQVILQLCSILSNSMKHAFTSASSCFPTWLDRLVMCSFHTFWKNLLLAFRWKLKRFDYGRFLLLSSRNHLQAFRTFLEINSHRCCYSSSCSTAEVLIRVFRLKTYHSLYILFTPAPWIIVGYNNGM
jgi:hypothetical protein